jgi:hypothetical protein
MKEPRRRLDLPSLLTRADVAAPVGVVDAMAPRSRRLPRSAPSESRSRLGVFDRLVALSHYAVTSDPAIARKQLPDLLQRLRIVASSGPDPARVRRP